jgi:sulfotransferase family protein
VALKIVGSGLGRTGTLSLKLALEQLGYTRCYHMIEVFLNQPHAQLWIGAAEGRPEWEKLFDGYAATVDYPGAQFWRELADFYPDAKVLHSVRDPEKWFESTQATIFSPQSPARNMASPEMKKFFESTVFREFGDKIHDREFLLAHFKRHTDEVVRTIPKERLLVYEVGSGWEPICRFLGVDVPDSPFPRENSREQFAARVERGRARGDKTPNLEHMQQAIREEFKRP